MGTQVRLVDKTTDKDGNQIQNLKYYGNMSENAELKFDPLPFEAFGKMARTTNRALSTAIKEYYGKIFHDLRGAYIAYVPGAMAPFVTELYFAKNSAPMPTGKIENLTDLTTINRDRNNLFYQKQVVDNKAVGKHYTLNEQTKLLLGDIMFGGKDACKPNNNKWNQYINEVWVPTGDFTFNPRAGELLLRVSGCFDIHRILTKIYGTAMVTRTVVEDDGSGEPKAKNFSAEGAYEARFIKYAFNEPNVFVMNIEQFDKSAVEEMTVRENPIRRNMVSGVVYY